MRVFLDTNVLIAAFISQGTCAGLLEYCISNTSIASSEFILAELREKLHNRFGYTSEAAEEAVSLVRSVAIIVTPPKLPSQVCRDSDDDHVLAAAVHGGCDVIITGDKDLLVVHEFQGVTVVTPTTFMADKLPG